MVRTVKEVMDAVDRKLAKMEAAREIRCPKCKYLYDWEDVGHHASFHGENGPQRADCPNCEHPFMVEECVERTFEITEIEGEDVPGGEDPGEGADTVSA